MTGRDRWVLRVACVLIACAALPVVHLRLAKWSEDACARPDSIHTLAAFEVADKLKHRTTSEHYGVFDRTIATFANPGAGSLEMDTRLIRTRDLAPFVADPLHISGVFELSDDIRRSLVRQTGDAQLPIQLLSRESRFLPYVVAWLYVMGGEPVESPWRSALRRAITSPLSAPQPLTLIVAESYVLPESARARETISIAWIEQVFVEMEQVCSP